MTKSKFLRWFPKILLLVSVAAIFFYLKRPITTNDAYFGLKIGEYIVEHRSIPDREIFSWSAAGRPIVMYEWLAQVWIFILFKIGGFALIESYTALMGVAMFLLVLLIFRRVFRQAWWLSLAFSWFAIAAVAEFITPRPYLVAFVGFLILFYVIFRYLFSGRNILWLVIPLTYIWTNSHGSFIFVPGLLALYSLIGFIYYYHKESAIAVKRAKTLAFFTILSIAITFFPPLWSKPYQWLFHFFKYLPVFSRYVVEWRPLGEFSFNQRWYGAFATGTVFFSVIFSRVTQRWSRWALAAPLVMLAVVSFQAIRHVVFGTLSLILILGLFLPLQPLKHKRLIIPFFLIILVMSLWLLVDKRSRVSRDEIRFKNQMLLADIEFLRRNRLSGHMLNEFSLGSYLLYYLYPQYQVMIDARADVYVCCELLDALPITEAKHASRQVFAQAVDTFLKKYDVSYFIVPYTSQNPLEQTSTTLMADLLMDNPQWRLIYASDDWQILLKNDGMNQDSWDNDSMTAATPYRLAEFRSGQAENAEREYDRLITIQNSGVAENGLGAALLVQEKFDEARLHFEQAVKLNPYFGKPYLGLSKIELHRQNIPEAISDLRQAISLSPHLGEAHLLLGQTYSQIGQKEQAISILNKGLDADVDLLSRQKMAQLLHELEKR